MNPFTEELSGITELEQRKSDLQNYLAGLDLAFGLTRNIDDLETIKKIKEKANVAGERQLGREAGVDVYVDRAMAEIITRKLGEEKSRHYLGVYKEEVQEKMFGTTMPASPSLQEYRNKAKESLFMTKDVRRIMF
ncbi:MAG TPA: hypothetical protein PLI45_04285 [Candidatus Woesebacteria bacterium]|nr:hypothetical protein [Candidatus Woesebacteria bacterium]